MPWSAVTTRSTLFLRQTQGQLAKGLIQCLHRLQVAVRTQVLPGAINGAHIDQHDEGLAWKVLDYISGRIQPPGIVPSVAGQAPRGGVLCEFIPPFLEENSYACGHIVSKAGRGLRPVQGIVAQIKNGIHLLQNRHGVAPLQNGQTEVAFPASCVKDGGADGFRIDALSCR